jgi:flagellar basal body-associated protein FliL
MAAEENQEATGAAHIAAPASSGTSKVVVIASVVNTMATAGIIVVMVLAYQKEKSRPSVDDIVNGQARAHGVAKGGQGDAKEGHGGEGAGGEAQTVTDAGKIVPLEPFTVNLSTGLGTNPRFVGLNVSVELEQGVNDKEFDIKLPRVRDTIINLLNSKKATEVNSVDGREQLKEEIKRSVNGFLLVSKVKAIYFTNFRISN